MKRPGSHRYVQAGLRIVVGAIFFYGGFISIQSPTEFADSIAAYDLLPALTINSAALVIPPLEMIIGALLVVGRPRRVAVFSGLVLTIIFAIALTSALARGLVIDCGCFGHGSPSRMKMWIALGRDLFLGGLLVMLYRNERRFLRSQKTESLHQTTRSLLEISKLN
jgi:uncharacterized membrane protein YphA (DoxX/SURF4 family)